MINISGTPSEENVKTYFVLNNSFQNLVPFMKQGEINTLNSDRLRCQ
jgi:hypothetical protein